MATIEAAVEAAYQRKLAAGVDESKISSEETIRRVCVGLDVDFDELMTAKRLTTRTGTEAILILGIPPLDVIGGMWIDGLITGLVLAELRKQEEAKDDAKS